MDKRMTCLIAASLYLVGCTSPYVPGVVETFDKSSQSQGFEGIRSVVAKGGARVVWVHGMCTHDASWALQSHSELASALGIEPGNSPALSPIDGPQRITFEDSVAGNRLEVTYLVWSPLDAEAKRTLFYDALPADRQGGTFPFTRASLNETLKVGLLNDCLADAVVYTGKSGDPIRQWMRAEVCHALGGAFSAPAQCEIPDGVKPVPTILVSESLGSKILFDAIRAIWAGTSGSAEARLSRHLASVQLVFMMANQVPLLDIADFSGVRPELARTRLGLTAPSTTGTLAQIIAHARAVRLRGFPADAPSSQLHIVAFTDPNDLLSYRLTPASVGSNDAAISNVIVSNDTTYFGVLERPDTAHCGYAWNATAIGAIVNGYDGQTLSQVSVNAPHNCGLTSN